MKDKVIAIVSKAAKLEISYLAKNTSKQLWDSLKHFEIILLLEDEFDVRLDVADITAMRSVDAIVETLLRIQGGKE